MNARHSLLILLVLIASLFFIAPAGCATTEEAREARARAVAAQDALAAQAQGIEHQLATLPSDDPARPELESRLVRSRTAEATLARGIAQIDASLNAHPSTPAPEYQIVDALDDLLPAPWRAPLLLGGVGLGLFLRSRQLRQGITTIAQGIEIAKREDPAFLAAFERHANTFRSIQSPIARRVVDEITRKPRPAAALGGTGGAGGAGGRSKGPFGSSLPRKSRLEKTSTKAPASYSQQ